MFSLLICNTWAINWQWFYLLRRVTQKNVKFIFWIPCRTYSEPDCVWLVWVFSRYCFLREEGITRNSTSEQKKKTLFSTTHLPPLLQQNWRQRGGQAWNPTDLPICFREPIILYSNCDLDLCVSVFLKAI